MGDDDFAFALVNMLLALSGSQQGCREISGKASLLSNLCSLLQVGTQRLQRAVLSVLRRAMLEHMTPAQATRLLTPYIQSVRAGGIVGYLLSLAATPFHLNCRVPGSPPQATSLADRQGCPASLAGGSFIGELRPKAVFLSHLYIKTIILPRQARDKHRESSTQETRPFFLRWRDLAAAAGDAEGCADGVGAGAELQGDYYCYLNTHIYPFYIRSFAHLI
eukprot:COSAG06_NODE_9572_length_1867_cov_2.289027_3_plen_220_part_00